VYHPWLVRLTVASCRPNNVEPPHKVNGQQDKLIQNRNRSLAGNEDPSKLESFPSLAISGGEGRAETTCASLPILAFLPTTPPHRQACLSCIIVLLVGRFNRVVRAVALRDCDRPLRRKHLFFSISSASFKKPQVGQALTMGLLDDAASAISGRQSHHSHSHSHHHSKHKHRSRSRSRERRHSSFAASIFGGDSHHKHHNSSRSSIFGGDSHHKHHNSSRSSFFSLGNASRGSFFGMGECLPHYHSSPATVD
jgi:hypothetical protein